MRPNNNKTYLLPSLYGRGKGVGLLQILQRNLLLWLWFL